MKPSMSAPSWWTSAIVSGEPRARSRTSGRHDESQKPATEFIRSRMSLMPVVRAKSDPVSWDTKLARMTVTKEAGHGDEAKEAGNTAGAVQSIERGRAPR